MKSFDHLAPVYAALELVTFGSLLDRARRQHLPALSQAERVLILGEGDGRFLERLLAAQPDVHVTCIDASAAMLRRAERRVARLPGALERVRFTRADARALKLDSSYDAVVTQFFLDCFEEPALGRLIDELGGALKPGGSWLYVDFAPGGSALGRLRSRAWIWSLYRAFAAVTDLAARRLVDPRPGFGAAGLVLAERRTWSRGLVTSELWHKRASRARGQS